MEEVDGETEASKTGTETKRFYWKTYKVELQPFASELYENSKEDICLFRTMLEELKEIIKRSTFHIEFIQILTHSSFRKKNKRIRCLETLSNEEQSIKKRSL